MIKVSSALATLVQWAEAGGRLEGMAPADDFVVRLAAPAPEYDNVEWALPPSYLAFLSEYSQLLIKWGPDVGHDEFHILDPDGIVNASVITYMPNGVATHDGQELSTNHLVPFATGGDDECAFCFDVTGDDAEYPVYFHHQDQPRARLRATGAWVDPDDATPDFPNFAAWLTWVATELVVGREPENSYPSAFMNMPGRRAEINPPT